MKIKWFVFKLFKITPSTCFIGFKGELNPKIKFVLFEWTLKITE